MGLDQILTEAWCPWLERPSLWDQEKRGTCGCQNHPCHHCGCRRHNRGGRQVLLHEYIDVKDRVDILRTSP